MTLGCGSQYRLLNKSFEFVNGVYRQRGYLQEFRDVLVAKIIVGDDMGDAFPPLSNPKCSVLHSLIDASLPCRGNLVVGNKDYRDSAIP